MEPVVLNIAAGKMDPLGLKSPPAHYVVNLDTMYYRASSPEDVESIYSLWIRQVPHIDRKKIVHCNEDAFRFMERTKLQFDVITCYRFLEHVSFTQVPYFIYLMSTCLKIGGIVDIIVPNYTTLARMVINEVPGGPNFEADNILLTTELLNEPGCPHASIWTALRAKYFFHLEGRFEVINETITESFEYDGRDIYLRFQARRIR